MKSIDKAILGDNQFFGISHMSQERGQQLAERFSDLSSIFEVYEIAFEAGVRAIMLNSNDRAVAICDRFRSHGSRFSQIVWYPSIPYPHKYANIVAEKGIVGALQNILFQQNSAISGLGKLAQGGLALVSMDAIKLMKMLVDAEMETFKGLNIRVVFLQNIVTDLILGLDIRDVFVEYCEHVRRKYAAIPGLITQNMPYLRSKLLEWGLSGVAICSSINKRGFLMSPNVAAYEAALMENDPSIFPMMAMSTLASGALRAVEAYDYINGLNLQSVVFGASTKNHIDETLRLIRLQ